MTSSATVIGRRYELHEVLGSGGMGEVWSGVDRLLHRPVAVKVLRSERAADPDLRQRFQTEARSAGAVHHPNVVTIFDAGDDDGVLYLVMERLPGRTLADRLREEPLTVAEARALAIDVLAALQAAHGARLVHRDVKPGNILLAEDGRWKVADFGIAKPLDVATDLTGTGGMVGTPAYLAPEQLAGQPATPASDLWALGVVLYESLTGHKPFTGETAFAIAHAVRTEVPAPVATVHPGLDPGLAAAIDQALMKDPGRRPANAEAMAAMLASAAPAPSARTTPVEQLATAPLAMDQTAILAPSAARPLTGPAAAAPRPMSGPEPWGPPPPDDRRRRLALAAAVVALLLAGIVAAVLLATNRSRSGNGSPTTTTTAAPSSAPGTGPTTPGTSTAQPGPTSTSPPTSDAPSSTTTSSSTAPSTTAAPSTTPAPSTTAAPSTSTSTTAPPATTSTTATTTTSRPPSSTSTTTGPSTSVTTLQGGKPTAGKGNGTKP